MLETRPALSSLARAPAAPGSARRRLTSLLPAAILVGFALLFLLLFRDRLIPARKVEVAPARAIEVETSKVPETAASPAASGKLLFQASGWIEPDPLPLKATALTDGVVDQVHVLEGQLVKKGDLLATLVEIDSRLAMDAAARELAQQKAALEAHCTGTQIAIQQMEAEKAGLISDEADATEAADLHNRYSRMPAGAIAETDRVTARLGNARRQADLLGRKARIEEIAHEMNRISFEVSALQEGIKAAEIKLAQATLAHERTRVLAPADGRVLRLLAAPGQKKMIGMDDEDSATIAILYDPAHLQVRVDVPLADAAGLGVGQRAKVRCSLLPDAIFEGEVTRIKGEADLQRNTLQAKVRISNPDEKLRPEMLCRVEFLDTAPAAANTGAATSGADLAVFIPETAVRAGSVWICDPDTRRVSKRAVTLSSESRDGHRRAETGIRPGEWVVLNPDDLSENQRVNPVSIP